MTYILVWMIDVFVFSAEKSMDVNRFAVWMCGMDVQIIFKHGRV